MGRMEVVQRSHKFRLGRTKKQRRHLLRSLTTHLVMHERIRTTFAKARHMQPTVDALIRRARMAHLKNNQKRLNLLVGFLETKPA